MELWSNYLGKIDGRQATCVEKVSVLVKETEPTAEAALPYGVPGYEYKGKNLIAFAAHKNHFGVYPFSPSIVKKIVGSNPSIDYAEGTLRFDYDNLPKKELIEQIIRLRINEIVK